MQGLLDHADSMTGAYLSGRREIPVPAVRRPRTKGRELTVHGAYEHNLQDIDVSFPLGLFVAVTGVSGSGKSTLVNDILYTSLAKQLYRSRAVPGRHRRISGVDEVDKVIHVDQSPIGRTPRSNPATYTGVFDHVRKLFASTPEAKMRGYQQGRFSFNVKGGRCEACSGDGTIKIEMNFLPDVYVPCEVCHGARYNRETLEVHYKGKTIAEVLDMPIEEAKDFFAAVPAIARHMQTLCEVGLGYVRLGQPATTLSGGEAQRVKLSSELQKRSTGRTVYVLDEPTTGLHFEDIRKLLGVLSSLVDKGNSVLVIEHNLDVIKTADWIVDMGPDGGSRGGLVVAEGTPEDIAAHRGSYTGAFLRPLLEGREAAQPPRPRRKPGRHGPGREAGSGQEDRCQEARRQEDGSSPQHEGHPHPLVLREFSRHRVEDRHPAPTSRSTSGRPGRSRNEETSMKYVVLIHSNPQPWGHPTSEFVAEFQALPAEQKAQMEREFDALLTELHGAGELVGGEALADPASSRLFRWSGGRPLPTDGPYSESKEHLAGFFLIDVASQARAEEVAAQFSGPGETVELRPAMWPGGDDQ